MNLSSKVNESECECLEYTTAICLRFALQTKALSGHLLETQFNPRLTGEIIASLR